MFSLTGLKYMEFHCVTTRFKYMAFHCVTTRFKYMAFHCVTTRFKCVIINRTEYSFLSQQSVKSVHKRAGFLSLNQISELVWDSEINEAGAPSDNTSEDKGGFEEEPRVSHLQLD